MKKENLNNELLDRVLGCRELGSHKWTIRGACYVRETIYGYFLYIGETRIKRLFSVEDLNVVVSKIKTAIPIR